MPSPAPKAVHLKDYQPTPYLIDTVKLVFDLAEKQTRVRATLRVKPNPKSNKRKQSLVLDGEKIKLKSVSIDGRVLSPSDYKVTTQSLTILNVPARAFTLSVETECDPIANTELAGLYMSNGVYCTQCEAEGFRRITYFYDRPDVLARFHVRIEAPISMPVLLSNGNPVGQGQISGTDRHFAEWDDPHPKPSYLFALVAGNLAHVSDDFTTSQGHKVKLGIYVEHGKQRE